MCGIVGYFGNKKINLNSASKSILHRGPDKNGKFKSSDWHIHFNRLSIIDISNKAMQPFKFDGVTIFFNGEIYNYIELKNKYFKSFKLKSNSDGEILPLLYRKKGINFLNYLNGMFSIIIIDEKEKKKYLIRDRFGQKPIYYCKKKKFIYIFFRD